MITIKFEHTDTFGGEANYSWARRQEFEAKDSISDRTIIRKAKAFAGFTGLRCRVYNYGDILQINPVGKHAPCETLFVYFEY